jgi:MarR family transcriptional regulator, organic hydroperoxide resistance regulator
LDYTVTEPNPLASWPTGRLLSVAARLTEHSWERLLSTMSLTHAGLIALHVIEAEPLPQRGLARRCRVTDQTISRTVDRLVQAGYAERTMDEADRRRVMVSITEKGRCVYGKASCVAREDPTLVGAVDDHEELRRQLVKLIESIGLDD